MLPTKNEILNRFAPFEYVDHLRYGGVSTFSFLPGWNNKPVSLELPRVKIIIHDVDFLRIDGAISAEKIPVKMQQDHFRLWYQIDGTGILQNVTANTFGTARPGLLGIMKQGERHTYLHQRGTFEGLTVDFSILPSRQTRCYWNTEVEGKCVLQENERLYFENLTFDMFRIICTPGNDLGVAPVPRLIEIISILLNKGLLLLEDEQFPRNKPKSLVALARSYMNSNYATIRHQRELAQQCGVDINYLNVLFERECKKTLYQYLTEVRMEHARHLLEDNKIPIIDIAGRTGYPNSNSFSRAFRKHSGKSPSEYRTAHTGRTPRPATAAQPVSAGTT